MTAYLYSFHYKDNSRVDEIAGNKMTWVDDFFYVKTQTETEWIVTFMAAMDTVKKIYITEETRSYE